MKPCFYSKILNTKQLEDEQDFEEPYNNQVAQQLTTKVQDESEIIGGDMNEFECGNNSQVQKDGEVKNSCMKYNFSQKIHTINK